MSSGRTRAGYLCRCSEGKMWYRIGENDGVIDVAVLHVHDNRISIRKIRRTDYDRTECYPSRIPCFTSLKVF